ncbi:MAG: DUF1499 domain-containing protein [Oscillatoriales cyanobacterium SM2_1_8]|nr:DUF1499 domain-containing protein [Oscillatoriales cyanobacterium SM2_1_8]
MKRWLGLLVAILAVVIPILAGQVGAFAGTRPIHPDLAQGQLAPCPTTPNCVVSSATADPVHFIAPIAYTGDRQTAQADLLKILGVVPRTAIWHQGDRHIQAESRSRLLGFVDDVEFYFPDRPEIEMRSASRLGESDLGVNRRRLEQIRLAFADYRAARPPTPQ